MTITSSDEPSSSRRRAASQTAPSWYEAQDLKVLKAWSNEIREIQSEISMFGSLKTVDVSAMFINEPFVNSRRLYNSYTTIS